MISSNTSRVSSLLVAVATIASSAAITRAEPEAATPVVVQTVTAANSPLPIFSHFRTLTKADGMPSDKVMSAQFDGDTLWAGTDAGLAEIVDGSIRKVYTTADGLPYPVIAGLSLDKKTGDLWVGTFGGLGRLSGGKFTTFTQLNSGLINNVIHGLHVVDDEVWIATAAGTSVYNTSTQQWTLFDQTNSLMKEPWCYSVASNDTHVFLGVWGAGALEWDRATKHWKLYSDPDGEFEVDVFKDDGLVHDIVTSVGYGDGILWVGSYFGLSRYDGRHWKTFIEDDSPLPSDFVQNMKTLGRWTWCCTDNGLAATDGTTWAVYQGDGGPAGVVTVTSPDGQENAINTVGSIGHSFVYGLDVSSDQIAVGTAHGLSIGTLVASPQEPVAAGR